MTAAPQTRHATPRGSRALTLLVLLLLVAGGGVGSVEALCRAAADQEQLHVDRQAESLARGEACTAGEVTASVRRFRTGLPRVLRSVLDRSLPPARAPTDSRV